MLQHARGSELCYGVLQLAGLIVPYSSAASLRNVKPLQTAGLDKPVEDM
jgi:hypothetical protein